MAITTDDFNKIWASTSPLTPYSFSESQYKEGWNFIGSTPPARQMWDFLQKRNDEKAQWLYNNNERVSAKGTYVIRFESGIQICWGTLNIPAGTSGREVSDTMTFPFPFANNKYVLTFGNDWCASSSEYYRSEDKNAANFRFTAVSVNSNPHEAFYIAIGYWK